MPSGQLRRERILARHLYSLQCCLSDRSQFLKPLPSRAVCCPRIYNAFNPIGPEESESVPLKFIEPFKNPWQRQHQRGVYDLLFRASVKEKTGSESTVLVKVPLDSTYGSDAHVLAASAGFAPHLLGKTGVAGAPNIYVMELLSKNDGWFHLVYFELPTHITEEQKESLRRRGKELIHFLSSNQLVHGDLRGCNIMCRLDGNDVHLRVLDWDWAGKQGTARYPATLNVELLYQGKPGGLIDGSHDEYMLEKTLDAI
ncbi:hypothetical protein M407DRAFT_219325 [Tulasnella calospora MUT 4182]|uniref:Non-specific serine/threonine protein kinase n=1 Tax=Tulasnella calospora MUT 4182 TaxID=1051891 RepID=A0A0C3LC83_9AGAM|nr:hypothetical protein M407DRAFT_219325 [Tulasnella calospora MUT 4182]